MIIRNEVLKQNEEKRVPRPSHWTFDIPMDKELLELLEAAYQAKVKAGTMLTKAELIRQFIKAGATMVVVEQERQENGQ